jgi:hypothetical protein
MAMPWEFPFCFDFCFGAACGTIILQLPVAQLKVAGDKGISETK